MEDGLIEPVTRAEFDRRVVVKGAAWSVPVIAMGVGVPAAAASPPISCKPVIITDFSTKKTSHWTPHWYDHKGLLEHKLGKLALLAKWKFKSKFQGHPFPVKLTDCDGKPLVGAKITVLTAGTVKGHPLLSVNVAQKTHLKFLGKGSATGITDGNGVAYFEIHVNAWAKLFLLCTGTLTVNAVAPDGQTVKAVFTVRVKK